MLRKYYNMKYAFFEKCSLSLWYLNLLNLSQMTETKNSWKDFRKTYNASHKILTTSSEYTSQKK